MGRLSCSHVSPPGEEGTVHLPASPRLASPRLPTAQREEGERDANAVSDGPEHLRRILARVARADQPAREYQGAPQM